MPLRPLKILAALMVSFFCLSSAVAQSDAVPPKRNIQIQVSKFKTDAENMVWVAYGISLAHYVETTGLAKTAPEGEYIPSFEGEIAAREKLLRIWREVTEKQALSYPYMDTLLQVESAGFLRQYIWQYHRRPTWKDDEAPPNQEAFVSWATSNLAGHLPMTGARLIISTAK